VQIANELATNPAACSVVLGFLSEYPIGHSTNSHLKVLGEPMELYEVAMREGATHAVVVESSLSWESLRYIVRSMHASQTLQVLLAPGLFDVGATPLQSTQLGRALLLAPRATRIYGFEALFKRGLDLLVAIPTLALTFPLQVGILGYLRLTGVKHPVETLPSLGFSGTVINVWRFAGGRRLRASHLTRLPSLYRVVHGQMSLIGPRPIVIGETGPYQRWRDVLTPLKPGFIGPWWLTGQHRPADLTQEIEADLNYARTYSIWMDLKILLAVGWTLLAEWARRANRQPGSEPLATRVPSRDED
jgi:lipopolysaccharide/colanic/teichoic acid biosynthesis glycosyltransferase